MSHTPPPLRRVGGIPVFSDSAHRDRPANAYGSVVDQWSTGDLSFVLDRNVLEVFDADTGLWGPVTTEGGGGLIAHKATHADGGSDEVALDASQTVSGKFPIARIATGTPDGTKFVRDDGTLANTGTVIGPLSAEAANLASFSNTSGQVIGDSGVKASELAPFGVSADAGNITTLGSDNKPYTDASLIDATARVRWVEYTAAGQSFEANDLTRDGAWTSIANKATTERPSPGPIGQALYNLPDNPTWTGGVQTVESSVVYTGVRVSMEYGGEIEEMRFWAPDVAWEQTYRLYTLTDPEGDPEVDFLVEVIVGANTPGWVDWTIGNLYPIGSVVDLVVSAMVGVGDTEVDATYNYLLPNNLTDPAAGEITHAKNTTEILRVNAIGVAAVDNTALLTAISPGDEITTGANTWTVQSSIGPTAGAGGTYWDFTVAPATRGIAELTNATFTFVRHASGTIGYVNMVNGWALSPSPLYKGTFSPTGPYLPQSGSGNAYGVDVRVQYMEQSDDWDIVAYSGGSGGGSGPEGPDGAPGVGVPAGGADGQQLAKASATDYDTEWVDGGDVVGPASVAAGNLVFFDGTTGKLIEDLGVAPSDLIGWSAFDAKGELLIGDGASSAHGVSVGTNDQVLTADSAELTGVKWATPTPGDVATDTIWDAAGDLAVGSGADTAVALPKGSDDDVLTMVAGNVAWAAASGGGALAAPLIGTVRSLEVNDYLPFYGGADHKTAYLLGPTVATACTYINVTPIYVANDVKISSIRQYCATAATDAGAVIELGTCPADADGMPDYASATSHGTASVTTNGYKTITISPEHTLTAGLHYVMVALSTSGTTAGTNPVFYGARLRSELYAVTGLGNTNVPQVFVTRASMGAITAGTGFTTQIMIENSAGANGPMCQPRVGTVL